MNPAYTNFEVLNRFATISLRNTNVQKSSQIGNKTIKTPKPNPNSHAPLKKILTNRSPNGTTVATVSLYRRVSWRIATRKAMNAKSIIPIISDSRCVSLIPRQFLSRPL